jgi:hypothetical protein
MGGIEECIFEIFGKEKIFGSTSFRVLCHEKEKK